MRRAVGHFQDMTGLPVDLELADGATVGQLRRRLAERLAVGPGSHGHVASFPDAFDHGARRLAGRTIAAVFRSGKQWKFSLYNHATGKWEESPPIADKAQAEAAATGGSSKDGDDDVVEPVAPVDVGDQQCLDRPIQLDAPTQLHLTTPADQHQLTPMSPVQPPHHDRQSNRDPHLQLATRTGGTPYGASHLAGPESKLPLSDEEKRICRTQGRRMAETARRLTQSR